MSLESLKDDLKNPEVAGSGLPSSCSGIYEFGDFRLDATKRFLFRNGVVVPLTPKAFDVLLVLVSSHGQVVGKDELLSRVWHDTVVEENNLNVNVSLLRKTLGERPNDHQFIVTVPGLGYQFVAEVQCGESSGTDLKSSETSNRSEPQPRPIGGSTKILLSLCLAVAIAIFAYFAPPSRKENKAGTIRSVAVLPFVNKTNDVEAEYLSEGISESLINSLSQLPSVTVIARSSSFKYKGPNIDPQQAIRDLGVDAIVMGQVSQIGDKLVISAELINASNIHEWGDQYNRKRTDVLDVQSEISREIAQTLRLHLTPGEQQQLVKRETVNPQAYELLLKGRFSSEKEGTENRKKAVEYYQQAITMDPAYALAYAELSNSFSALINNNLLDPKEFAPQAEAAARKALELDETLPEAHLAMAIVKIHAWDWAVAEHELKRGIELNPNLTEAHFSYAVYLGIHGRRELCVAELNRVRELDPLSVTANWAVFFGLMNLRQYDQAIEAVKKLIERDPRNPEMQLWLCNVYTRIGQYREALAACHEAISLGDNSPDAQIWLGMAYGRAGERGKARAILEKLKTAKEYVSPIGFAIIHAALAEKEQAFALLETAYAARDQQLIWLRVETGFDPLRSDPRFADLMRRVGLSP